MTSTIDQLEEALWGACVIQRAAPNEDALERWQTDELSHLRERFVVRPMPDALTDLVQRALAEWQGREQKVCSALDMTSARFLSDAEKLRTDFLGGGPRWRMAVQAMSPHIHGAVRNMDWVNLFSWILPAADAEHAQSHRAVGRMVTGIYYVELLSRHEDGDDPNALRKIEARWLLAA